jgi:NTP pyrophosphatase (non-canonical NTP hydrolase)
MTTINRITGHDLARFNTDESLRVYQEVATKSAIYPGQGTPLGLAYCALKLNGEAGELAEHVGKAMRDDGLIPYDPGTAVVYLEHAKLTDGRKALIIKEVGDVLWYLSAICNELGISLAEAAMINLEKLKDRTDRDALRGSGDER